MKKNYHLVLFLLLLSTARLLSQHIPDLPGKLISTTHFYTFSGKAAPQSIDELETILSKIEFVSQAKVKYKPEKEMGQVIIIVKQPIVVRENQKEFNPTSIKKTLISLGFTPIQYSKEASR